MNAMKTRYPGAQPFPDDAVSRKLFFGRDRVARLLTDQILAKRMIVLYAKSGLGKTSLLNAAVAPQLRDEGHFPLVVTVNDVEMGPCQSVLNGIRAEAARQQVEFVPGDTDSLWNFFSTSEFWRGDLLLVPVLILDQFEKIFTLQGEQHRKQFLAELSYLVRGVPPPSSTSDSPSLDVSASAPLMHIVLSLREDYLGFLEEAADQIPQILDARFRLAPLDLQAAEDAITGPASVEDPFLNTHPFTFERDAVAFILNYLSKRMTKSSVQSAPHVEPFQLQLICLRLEQLAESRQQSSHSPVIITMNDVGGEAAITKTLKHFYIDTIGSLRRRRQRHAARRLCEDYLISPEGRRLSLEENEIYLQLKLQKRITKNACDIPIITL